MEDLLDLPMEIMSTRQFAKIMLKAYMMGIEDFASGEIKNKSIQELKAIVEPKFLELIINNKSK